MISTTSIWNQFHERLLLYIRKRISDPQAAEDLLQDVFIKIHNNVDKLRNDATIGSWVYRITYNTITDYYRNKKIQVDLKESHLQAEVEDENAARTEILEDMKEMISELPEKYRQAIMLTEFEGISQKQLAKHLKLSDSGAKSRVQRARLLLRDDLMRCCHFIFDKYNSVVDFQPHSCCCCTES